MVFSADYSNSNDFRFLIGQKEIILHRYFADFISPKVSHIHHSDPTVNSFRLDSLSSPLFVKQSTIRLINLLYSPSAIEINKGVHLIENIFSDDMIEIFTQVATGNLVSLNEQTASKLRLISIMIGNEELYNSINELYPNFLTVEQINSCLQYLQYFHDYNPGFSDNKIIEFLASHFIHIDKSELLQHNKSVILSIISNDHLHVNNEDDLFEFINLIFRDDDDNFRNSNTDEDRQISISSFYEYVEFSTLSKKNFDSFLQTFDPTEMSTGLWKKLTHCFLMNPTVSPSPSPLRYQQSFTDVEYEYDGDKNSMFRGIIHKLTEECGGNVNDKRVIEVSSSPLNSQSQLSKYVVDLDDVTTYFCSSNVRDSWICYDFKDRKVRPGSYSIRSSSDFITGYHHMINWCLEGSNEGTNWKILDSRFDEQRLNKKGASCNFEISKQGDAIDFYRYLRIRQTGQNAYSQHNLVLSALEFFGSLREKSKA